MQNHDQHGEDHHAEDPLVCYRVGIIFIAVLAAIIAIGVLN